MQCYLQLQDDFTQKTGIHHPCWEHISQGLKTKGEKKKKAKQPPAFPSTCHCNALAENV